MPKERAPETVRFSLHAWKMRKRAERNAIPPLFELTGTTKVLALMSHVGPVTKKDLLAMRPGINALGATRAMKPYIDAGLVVAFREETRNGSPLLWGLNPRHMGARRFHKLLHAVWLKYLNYYVPTQRIRRYRVPPRLQTPASGAPPLYSRNRKYDELLHLLAEFKTPIAMSPLRALLDAPKHSLFARMDVLVMFGLVDEKYKDHQRWFEITRGPMGAALQEWLGYVNRHDGHGRYLDLAKFYRKQRSLYVTAEWLAKDRREQGMKYRKTYRLALTERLSKPKPVSAPRLMDAGEVADVLATSKSRRRRSGV